MLNYYAWIGGGSCSPCLNDFAVYFGLVTLVVDVMFDSGYVV